MNNWDGRLQAKTLLTIRPDGHVEVNAETTRDELIAVLRRLGIPASVGRLPITIDVAADAARDALLAAALALESACTGGPLTRTDVDDLYCLACYGSPAYLMADFRHEDDCSWQALVRAAAAYRAAQGATDG